MINIQKKYSSFSLTPWTPLFQHIHQKKKNDLRDPHSQYWLNYSSHTNRKERAAVTYTVSRKMSQLLSIFQLVFYCLTINPDNYSVSSSSPISSPGHCLTTASFYFSNKRESTMQTQKGSSTTWSNRKWDAMISNKNQAYHNLKKKRMFF